MLKLKELEELLNEGYFDYPNYVEMHGGPHDFVLYENEAKKHVYKRPKGPIKIDGLYYIFTPWAYDPVHERVDSAIEYLKIQIRNKKIQNSDRSYRETGQAWYWTYETIFKGEIDSLEDLKKLLKQLGINKK